MADRFTVENIGQALHERSFPAVTVWNRLESRPRTLDFDRALTAEVRDALWMLARQWQLGELRGDDAGSPFLARLHASAPPFSEYRAGHATAEPFAADVPLEATVERRPIPLAMGDRKVALDLRLLMGRQWLKLISGIGDYRADFIKKYKIEAPDPVRIDDADRVAHPEVWQLFEAVAGRHMDGGALYLYLTGSPQHHAYDGIPVADEHRALLDERADQFVAWYERLFHQPPAGGDSAWIPDRLEYQFACSASTPDGERVYVADEYYDGRLDWYSVDIQRGTTGPAEGGATPTAEPPTALTQTVIPTPVEFEGMPNARWWAFEDRKTNFGAIDAATTDLAKLLFIEFGLVYANDWFLIPCTLSTGTVASIRGIAVTNVFGERFWIEPAGTGAAQAWQRWNMFTNDVRDGTRAPADLSLPILPTVPKAQQSDPVDEVALIRDENANMVWGVERVVPLASGDSKPGAEAAIETHKFYERHVSSEPPAPPPATPSEVEAHVRYRLMTSAPEHWIPFLPVRVSGDPNHRRIQLQRGPLPRTLEGGDAPTTDKVRPRTALLREGLDTGAPYLLHEEEVPRGGITVSQAFQRARWRNGRVFVWLGARKHVGRGEGSSGLAFDQLVDIPPSG